jgi:hypothetical protein
MSSRIKVVDALVSAINACQSALIELGAEGVSIVVGILKAALGPRGEYRLPGLASLNAAYLEKWPDGYTDQIGDPEDRSRIPLHLVESVIDARALDRADLSEELRAEIHHRTWNEAYGTYLGILHRDEVTGLQRFQPLWVDGVQPAPGKAAPVVVPPTHWSTDEQVLAAIRRYYEITYGPLA